MKYLASKRDESGGFAALKCSVMSLHGAQVLNV